MFARLFYYILVILGYILVLTIFLYTIVTGFMLFFIFDGNLISLGLNLIILFFELIAAIYGAFLLFHNGYAIKPTPNDPNFSSKLNYYPLISIILPTFNPDLYALETNLLSLKKTMYPKLEIIITDNSSDKDIIRNLKKLSSHFKTKFVHRDSIKGFKARNLNSVLPYINGEFFLIIDVDQIIKPNIDSLNEFIQLFEKDPKLAYIQAKFEIQNANGMIKTSLAILYSFYYDIISLAKDKHNTVLFNGSSACFRTNHVKEVGGFPETTYTEDISISTVLLSKGYHSRFLNKYITTALLPWHLKDLLSSFWRWAHGGTSLLRVHGRSILSSNISITKKIELILNGGSFIALSSVIMIAFAMLGIFYGNYELVRPFLTINYDSIVFTIPIGLLFPLLVTINYLFSSILALIESNTLHRFPYLLSYGIGSISLSFFIILPTIYALFGIKNPNQKNSVWDKEIKIKQTIIILTAISILFAISAYYALLQKDLLTIYFAFISFTALIPVPFLLFDSRINVENKNYEYFTRYRDFYNLTEMNLQKSTRSNTE